MDDLIRDFVAETLENIEVLDAELVRFEREPGNHAIIGQIYRLFHTIKGTCGFLSLPRLEALAHAAEEMIECFRSGEPASQGEVTLVLAAIDRIKSIVLAVAAESGEPPGSDADLIAALAMRRGIVANGPTETQGTLTYQVLQRPLRHGEATLDELELAFRSAPGPEDAQAAVAPLAESSPPRQATIRVAVERLDYLMTMVSELVLVRNQLVEMARRLDPGGFKGPIQRLSGITGELQEGVMMTRMQAVGASWNSLPRIVRDLAVDLGKDIRIESSGEDTEIDRQLLEVLKDCIVHVVRNAADHGIETRSERIAAGKPEQGVIRLSATRQGGFIVVMVEDDGRGLDIARIRDRALRNGLVDEDTLLRFSEKDIAELIFAPGFSTASAISTISGRGVGMDAVRSGIAQVGGQVELINRPGAGTGVVMKLPLTLAVAAVLIVEAGGQKFALPQNAVAELVRAAEGSETRIERINGVAMLRARDRLLPVVELAGALGLPSVHAEMPGLVAICQIGAHRFGLAVDVIHQTEEIVVKPLSSRLRHLPYFSGATILGDGSVILILEAAGFLPAMTARSGDGAEAVAPGAVAAEADKTPLLIVRAGGGLRKAVPLALVMRLEEIDAAGFQIVAGQPAVEYQGELMPLRRAAPDVALRQSGPQPVLVFSHAGRCIGLLVDEIIDVVDAALDIDFRHRSEGMLGCALINGETFDIVDAGAVICDLAEQGGDHDKAPRAILVEQSEFFRSLLAPLIRAAGYQVDLVRSVEELAAGRRRADYDLAVIDLDAMGDGAGQDQASPALADLRIGIATRAGRRERQRATAFGIDSVVGKFDRRGLISIIGTPVRENAA